MKKKVSDEFMLRREVDSNGRDVVTLEPYTCGTPWFDLDPEILHEITGWRLKIGQRIKVVLKRV